MTIEQKIVEEMAACGLHALPRLRAPEAWEEVWANLAFQPGDYAEDNIEYQHVNLASRNIKANDVSVVITSGNRPVGIWPLTLREGTHGVEIGSCNAPVWRPLFVPTIGAREKKRLCSAALSFLRQYVAKECDVKDIELHLHANPFAQEGWAVDEWYRVLLAAGGIPRCRYMLYVDLRSDLATIRASYRKSNKPLINKGRRMWHTFIMNASNAAREIWNEFRALHLKAAGRRTRAEITWNMQFDRVVAGAAFLAGLRDPKTQRLVGAGYFELTRDEGIYAVAAYDRSLFEKPLGHVVQDMAIVYMKELGLKYYKVGERHYPQLTPAPTEKEVSISMFKEGFSSHMFVETMFVLPYCGNSAV